MVSLVYALHASNTVENMFVSVLMHARCRCHFPDQLLVGFQKTRAPGVRARVEKLQGTSRSISSRLRAEPGETKCPEQGSPGHFQSDQDSQGHLEF